MSTKKIKQPTPDELAEAYVFPVKLSAKQEKESADLLKAARIKVQSEMTEEDRLMSALLQFKFQLEDYLSNDKFDPKLKFSHFLKEYVHLLNKKQKTFAEEIDIDETELSQLINNHRLPSDNIIIRLEIHSNNTIPAIAWYKLIEREKEHNIITNKEIRRRERKHVSNQLAIDVD